MSALTSKLIAIVLLTSFVAACATPFAPPPPGPAPSGGPIVRKG